MVLRNTQQLLFQALQDQKPSMHECSSSLPVKGRAIEVPASKVYITANFLTQLMLSFTFCSRNNFSETQFFPVLSISIYNNNQVFVKFPDNLFCNLSAFGFALGLCLFEVTQSCQTTIQFLLNNTHKKTLNPKKPPKPILLFFPLSGIM